MLRNTKGQGRHRPENKRNFPEELTPEAEALLQEMPAVDESRLGFHPASEEHVARERKKAEALRNSPWWQQQLAKGVCAYCGRHFPPAQLTMDHKIPLIRGGFTEKSNVVPCCKQCNSAKKYSLPDEMQPQP